MLSTIGLKGPFRLNAETLRVRPRQSFPARTCWAIQTMRERSLWKKLGVPTPT